MKSNLELTMPERLKERMKDKRLRQIDISKAIGASRGTVSKWLSGDAEPNHEYTLRLAEVLDVHPDWIMEGENYYANYDDLDDMENALKEENREKDWIQAQNHRSKTCWRSGNVQGDRRQLPRSVRSCGQRDRHVHRAAGR